MSGRTRMLALLLAVAALVHEGAARALDAIDVASRLLSPSSATGLAAGVGTALLLALRVALVALGPALAAWLVVDVAGHPWLKPFQRGARRLWWGTPG